MSDRPESVIVRHLERFRRRLIATAFVRRLYSFTPAAIAVVAIGVGVGAPGWRVALVWMASAAALACLSAFVTSIFVAPSLAATARTLDRRFRLEDCAVTALELADRPDEVSRLVVRDAGGRLEAHAVRELAFDSPTRWNWIAAAAAGAVLLIALLVTRPASTPIGAEAGDRSGAAGNEMSGGAGARTVEEPNSAGREITRQGAPSITSREEESRSAVGERPDRSLQAGEAAASRPAAGSPDNGGETRPSSQTTLATSAADSRERSGTESGSGSGAAARAGAAGSARMGGAARQVGSRQGGAGAAAFGTEAVAGTGAGGVKGKSPLTYADAEASRSVSANGTYAERYRRSLARAESPTARERVPARLRTYVRDYFLAIRPDQQP